MDALPTLESPSLFALVDSSHWQRLQEHFARVLGIPLRTVSSQHSLLTAPSWPATLNSERVIQTLGVGDELEQLLPSDQLPHEISTFTTPLGITYAAVPVSATVHHVLAFFVVGPMVVGPREDETRFLQRIGAMGHDAKAIWACLLSLKLYTFAGIRSALGLIEEVSNSVVQLAYQTKQLAALLPTTSRVDQALLTYHATRVFQSLLEAATLATKAEGGSVMVYDPNSDTFRIRAAQGLSEAVVSQARLKRGEGITGMVASQRTTWLLDDRTTDPQVTRWMRRPEVVSSLVAPVIPNPEQEPIGVISLRTSNWQRRFTQEHVEILQRLLALACMALEHLPTFFQQARTPAS